MNRLVGNGRTIVHYVLLIADPHHQKAYQVLVEEVKETGDRYWRLAFPSLVLDKPLRKDPHFQWMRASDASDGTAHYIALRVCSNAAEADIDAFVDFERYVWRPLVRLMALDPAHQELEQFTRYYTLEYVLPYLYGRHPPIYDSARAHLRPYEDTMHSKSRRLFMETAHVDNERETQTVYKPRPSKRHPEPTIHFVCLVPDRINRGGFKILVQADQHHPTQDAFPHGVTDPDVELRPSFEWISTSSPNALIALRLCANEAEPLDLLYEYDVGNPFEWRPLSHFIQRMRSPTRGLTAQTRHYAETYVFPYLQAHHPAILDEAHAPPSLSRLSID
jgi:hypothetical protein